MTETDAATVEPETKKGSFRLTLKIVGIILSTVVGLSVALQFTSIGYVSGFLVKLIDWYRWIAWSPWEWINVPLLSFDRDLFAVLGVIFGIGIRNRFWNSMIPLFDVRDMQRRRLLNSFAAIGFLFGALVLFRVGAYDINLLSIPSLVIALVVLFMLNFAQKDASKEQPIFLRVALAVTLIPLGILAMTTMYIVRNYHWEVLGIVAAVALILGGAIASESVFGDSLQPYVDAFPTAPEVGELPDFTLPSPND